MNFTRTVSAVVLAACAIIIFGTLCTGCGSAPTPKAMSPSPPVPAIRQMRGPAGEPRCTVWHVTGNLWMTAWHCVDDGVAGLTVAGRPILSAAQWQGQDVAALTLKVDAPDLKIAPVLPCFGEWVSFVGYPVAPDGVTTVFGRWGGYYNGLDGDGDIAVGGMVDGGASGAPLFNEAGEVVGVIVSSFRRTMFSYAEPLAQPDPGCPSS